MSQAAPPIRLLVNPEAGGGRAARHTNAVIAALEGHGLAVESAAAADRDHVSELAMRAARAGETVVTLGGDGIAGAAADGLRRVPGSVLGIIPSGRGNDLARVLRIPSDPLAACAVIAGGTIRPLDLGEVDGRAFVGIASAGFDSDANQIANLAPAWLGSGVYAYGALRALMRWRPATFQVELVAPAPSRCDFTGFSVAFANSRCFGGGMLLAPAAQLDDGLLDMVAIADMPRLRYAWDLWKVFKGTHVRLPTVHAEQLIEAVISADRPFTMYADGDPIGELPVRVRVLPAAIGVLTPPAPTAVFGGIARQQELSGRTSTGREGIASAVPSARAAGPQTLA